MHGPKILLELQLDLQKSVVGTNTHNVCRRLYFVRYCKQVILRLYNMKVTFTKKASNSCNAAFKTGIIYEINPYECSFCPSANYTKQGLMLFGTDLSKTVPRQCITADIFKEWLRDGTLKIIIKGE